MTPRQQNEIEFHAHFSETLRQKKQPLSHEVIYSERRKWWNHYWVAYSHLLKAGVEGRVALVPGCGAGSDAVRLAKLGAKVKAVDLSAEMLDLAQESAHDESVYCDFGCMPVEQLLYPDNTFDLVFVRDLLHHCDIAVCMRELARVCKPGAFLVIDELYTHTALQALRESVLGRWLYTKVQRIIYRGEKPYITPDERKINESEMDLICAPLSNVQCTYFNTIANRFVPDSDAIEVFDRALLKLMGPLGRWSAGRILVTGYINK